MEYLLDNPVYHALISNDAHLGYGAGDVRYFDEAVSPFVGFPQDHSAGFDELYAALPQGRKILYATIKPIEAPAGWQQLSYIKGSQFVYDVLQEFPANFSSSNTGKDIIPLNSTHAEEMVQLAALTKPGPFDKRTIDFGYYHGIFEDGKLVAMTGQRLHPGNYTEVSAVCTHPDHLGKGYATLLLEHQLGIILHHGQIPFLHVRADNERAIAVYERLGFYLRGPMHFYFMRKK